MSPVRNLTALMLSTTLLSLALQPLPFIPTGFAQSRDPRKAEAEQLLKICRENLQKQQLEVAIRSCQEVAEKLQQRGHRDEEIKVLNDLGNVYSTLSNYPRAIEYYEQSLAIAREVKDRRMEINALQNLGNVYYRFGKYPRAIEYYEQSLAIAREVKDRDKERGVLNDLGNVYSTLSNYPRAIEYYEQGLAITRESKDRGWKGLLPLLNLGSVYSRLGKYPKAIEYYEQGLAIARESKDRSSEQFVLQNLGDVYYKLGNSPKAIEYYQQSLAIARESKNRSVEAMTLSSLGVVLFNSGKLAEAESKLLEVIQIVESVRPNLSDLQKVSLSGTQRVFYNNLLPVLIAQNKVEPALEISEWGRARAFAELLTKRTQGREALMIQPIQITAIKAVAREQRVTLVEYAHVSNAQLFIWVVKPTGEVTFRQVDLTPLKEQKTSLDNLVKVARCLGVRTCEAWVLSRGSQTITFNEAEANRQVKKPTNIIIKNEYLQQLNKLLIEPIADLLPTSLDEKVVFIPQDHLFLLPFALLQDQQGKYLIEKHTIAIAPSIQVLELTHKQRQQQSGQGDVLLVGNPTMPPVTYRPGAEPSTLIPLPGAEAEAKAISKLLGVPALIGNQATKAVVVERMRNARIIHLATHGLLDDLGQTGVPGAIALAASSKKPNDGLLTANELLDLKLQAELVVLSACDTGRGKITGDGVIGLSRALITAGVPSVIVSLWAVPDAPTADLMIRFYQNLNQGQGKAQALRNAMLATKEEYPDPTAWAAFTLIGESQ